MKNHTVQFVLVAGLFLAALPAAAQTDDPPAYQDGYAAGTYGRVRYQDPGVTLLRSDTSDDSDKVAAAGVNDAIFPGDSVRTDVDARAEVQLAGGTLVRIDRASDVSFLSLPDPYASVEDNTILDLNAGAIQLAAVVKNRQELRIDTPSSTIYLLGDGDFRIEVAGDGTTRVLSRRGVAEVTGNGASVLVRGGTRSVIVPGGSPEDARPFHTFASDSFDAWVASRSSAYERRDAEDGSDVDAYDQVPAEVRPYYRELSGYGRWVNVPTYGYAWSPSGYGPGWRPYLAGGWSYGPGGYFWVSSEPWGWAPYHYGRWSWVSSYGWCWIPGSVFGGAWVSWSWGPSHVGWCALDYWNRPAYYGHGHEYGYRDPASWTVVSYAHLGSRDSRRYAVPVDRAGALLQTSAVGTRPARMSPRVLSSDPSARQRVVNEMTQRNVNRGAPDRRPERAFTEGERQVARPRLQTPIARGRTALPSPERERARVPDRGILRVPPNGVRREQVPGRDRAVRGPSDAPVATPPGERGAEGDRRVIRRAPASPRFAPPQEAPRDAAPPVVVPQLREGKAADDHVREMYRRVARPRVTDERMRTAAPPAPAARPTPPPSQQHPAPAPPAAAAPPKQQQPPARTAPARPSAGDTRERHGHEGKKR